jgi:tRNA/tmRNA/rRNA uracil-C5-methylase (TrmA/RlmC/RlmD family)
MQPVSVPRKFNPHPFAYHQELELTISGLTNLGKGVARHDGWVIMVPFVIPGERVRLRVYRNHKNYSDADLIEVLEASTDRIAPRCSLYGECGGCQYQHIRYERQLQEKATHVRECFQKIGGLPDVQVSPAMSSSWEYGYRTKLTPHYPASRGEKRFPIGFLKVDSRHHIVDVPTCPIASDSINGLLSAVRQECWERSPVRGGTLLLRDCTEGVETDPRKIVEQNVGGLRFRHPAGEFFQNNPYVLEKMLSYVLDKLREHTTRYLVDAYCGSGLFSIAASPLFERVYGIEIAEGLVARASENATLNNVSNGVWHCGDASSIFEGLDIAGSETTLLVDPPRKGCSPEFLEQVFRFQPAQIVYVSCDPATQARDVRILLESGYALGEIQPVDLFPQTRHIESVATLSRK